MIPVFIEKRTKEGIDAMVVKLEDALGKTTFASCIQEKDQEYKL